MKVDDDGTGGIWFEPRQDAAFFDSASLTLGEVLYQLRAALDGCVYEAAIADSRQDHPPDHEKLEFPVTLNTKSFKNASAKIQPLVQKRKAIIEAVQPYNAPVHIAADELVLSIPRSLGILHDWARKDRHRKLHLIAALPFDATPQLRAPEGVTVSNVNFIWSGLLERSCQVAAFTLIGYRRGMNVQANPNVFLDIATKEDPAPIAKNDNFGTRIAEMANAVYSVVQAMEESYA